MRVFLVLLALLAVVFAQHHIDNTVVTIENGADVASDHFLISVDHIEDVVGDNGELLAERDIRVAIRFDAFHESFLVNGARVAPGFNQLKVKAHVMEVEANGQPRPFDRVISVNLRVFVGFRNVLMEDGTMMRAVYMQERVVGVQENEFWQADVVEQVFIYNKDGTISRYQTAKVQVLQGESDLTFEETPGAHANPDVPLIDPNHGSGSRPGGNRHHHGLRPQFPNGGNRRPGHHGHSQGHHQGGSQPGPNAGSDSESPFSSTQNWIDDEKQVIEQEIQNFIAKAEKFIEESWRWFYSLPVYQRILLSFATGMLLSVVIVCFLKCLGRCCCGKKKTCQSCHSCKSAATPANNYKENIRVYSLQYTAVPQDEKDAKKQEGSVEMV